MGKKKGGKRMNKKQLGEALQRFFQENRSGVPAHEALPPLIPLLDLFRFEPLWKVVK